MSALDHTPIPRIQVRRGFAWLPLEQQLSVCALIAALVVACLPLLIDPGRAASGELKPSLLKPRSVSAALARIERHVSLAWWTAGSAGEQRLRQKLLAVAGGIVLLGGAAGRKAQEPSAPTTSTTTTPHAYGTATTIRARSASTPEEDQHAH